MLQGRQIEKLTAKVARLTDVYSPFLIEEELIQRVCIDENGKEREIAAGDKWGGDFRYAQFSFTVTQDLKGGKYYLRTETGAVEHLITLNGKKVGMTDYVENAIDAPSRVHRYVLLEGLKQGDRVVAEGYYSHPLPGTMPYDKKSTFVLTGYYPDRCFIKISLVRFYEKLKEFIEKLELLNGYLSSCGEWEHARAEKVYERLFEILPLKQERPEDVVLDRAVKVIDGFFNSLERAKSPYVGIIGHSHLDTAWLWTVEETRHKLMRTVSNAVTLLKRYPDYKFFLSTVLYLKWIKEDDPSLFGEVKALIKDGRFEPNGGAWVECDCNLTGAEALCRQFVRGIRWLRQETGYIPDTFWLPDTFGYSAALPQILNGVGIKYFLTTKLSWNDTNNFPYENFRWKGIDGSEVTVHFNTIQTKINYKTVAARLENVRDKRESDCALIAYGFGDGGGGPSDEMVREAVHTQIHCPYAQVEHTTVSAFMQRLETFELPLYFGELYLELHRGTYTTNHDIKYNNRRLEQALHDAELISVLAGESGLKEQTDKLYDVLLLNEFHDILPGTCIEEAMRIAENEQRSALEGAKKIIEGDGKERAYFNTLSFERYELLPADGGHSYKDLDGNVRTLAPFKFKALGYGERCEGVKGRFLFDGKSVVTPQLNLTLEDGVITSLVYKGREYASGGINVIQSAEDVPYIYDNWDIDADYVKKLTRAKFAGAELVTSCGWFTVIRLKYDITDKTKFTTDLILRSDSPLIEFENRLSAYDEHLLIRASFGLSLFAPHYSCETQFGYLQRNCYPRESGDIAKFEVCSHKWTDLSEHNCGISLLSDCKYGVSCSGSTLGITLHKSGTHPDGRADKGVHTFRYALLPHEGGLGAETVKCAYAFNLKPVKTSRHGLSAPFSLELGETVLPETVKFGEEGGVVLRLYESLGASSFARISAENKEIFECNILEDIKSPCGNNAELRFKPFEIKTILIK